MNRLRRCDFKTRPGDLKAEIPARKDRIKGKKYGSRIFQTCASSHAFRFWQGRFKQQRLHSAGQEKTEWKTDTLYRKASNRRTSFRKLIEAEEEKYYTHPPRFELV